MNQPGYKEMQQILKQVVQEAVLDKSYRELCLTDSQAAIQTIINRNNRKLKVPDNIIFLEEDLGNLDRDGTAYILPPFLKPSWLVS